MGRNNADFFDNTSQAADRIKEARSAGAKVKYEEGGKSVTKIYPPLENAHEEEVDENAFNRTYEAWKKAGDPFYNKGKNKK